MKPFIQLILRNWQNALKNKVFRKNLITGLILFPVSLVITYLFFNHVEDSKGGIILNDWTLTVIPPEDVSFPIGFFLTSVTLLFFLRALIDPNMLLTFLFAYILLLYSRIITIEITGLLPPPGLIALKDPVSDVVYGSRFITKDLFYSGHTAYLFLLYLISYKKRDKYYMIFAVISVGILLLVQHVHYTIDIAFAPFFAFGCYWLAKKIIHYQGAYTN
ncbi:MAG: phosphatase PAP2-related protein [Bacteroidia bacterium]